MSNKILITGAAGFIGYHLACKIASGGDRVVGIDNINDYYDIELKYDRLKESGFKVEQIDWNKMVYSYKFPHYKFMRMNLEDKDQLTSLCETEEFDIIINLAAQAGIRYSMINPYSYVQSNLVGFLNILEAARNFKIKHLLYASSSSVYGMNKKMPFSVEDSVDHPISFYAATKRANELMAHSYSHLYNIPTTGLRFFTVYGPWGRPDMAYFLFANAIHHNQPIKVFNHGKLKRDFTYIDDIVNGIVNIVNQTGIKSPLYEIFNLGNNTPVELGDFIKEIEKNMGITGIKEMMDMQPGDVTETYADMGNLIEKFNYKTETNVEIGIEKFINWYKERYM